MKNLQLHKELEVEINEVNEEYIKQFMPEDCSLEIFGIGKAFKGRGHWRMTIFARVNGQLGNLYFTTTDSVSIDNYFGDTYSEEDIQNKADGCASLIAEALRDNDLTKLDE